MKKHAPSRKLKKRMKELENLSNRIEAKMVKLEKIVSEITSSLAQE